MPTRARDAAATSGVHAPGDTLARRDAPSTLGRTAPQWFEKYELYLAAYETGARVYRWLGLTLSDLRTQPPPMALHKLWPQIATEFDSAHSKEPAYKKFWTVLTVAYAKLVFDLFRADGTHQGGLRVGLPAEALRQTVECAEGPRATVFWDLLVAIGALDLDTREESVVDSDEDGDAGAGETKPLPPFKTLQGMQTIDMWGVLTGLLGGGVNVIAGDMRSGKTICMVAKAVFCRIFQFPSIVVECHNKEAMHELIENMNRGVSDPDFTVSAEEVHKKLHDLITAPRAARKAESAAIAQDIKGCKKLLVCHSNHYANLEYCTKIREALALTDVDMSYDECDCLFSTSGSDKPPTQREVENALLCDHRHLRCGTSRTVRSVAYVSATHFATIPYLRASGFKSIALTVTDAQRLQATGFSGIESVVPWQDAKGEDIYVGEDVKYGQKDCCGIHDPQVKAAISKYVRLSDTGGGASGGGASTMLVSLGSWHNARGGTLEQKGHILAMFAGDRDITSRLVIILANGNKGPQLYGAVTTPDTKPPKLMGDALALCAAPKYRVIVLGQRKLCRGINVATKGERGQNLRQVAYMVLMPSNTFNISNFYQLLGRCFGSGSAPRVEVLMKRSSFTEMMDLAKFQRRCLQLTQEGKDACDAEFHTDLLPTLSCPRPFTTNRTFDPIGALARIRDRQLREGFEP